MIDLYFWTTPNGWKISIMLEETGLPYRVIPVNLGRGDQFKPEFLAISPNNRMPAIIDHESIDGAGPLSIFESGAILLYLAQKSGQFVPSDFRGRTEVHQWLFWQVGGLGPMAGQAVHFRVFAPEPIPYAVDRYTREVGRLCGVMERRLADRQYLAGDYSVADMACYPWVVSLARQAQMLEEFPNVKRWFEAIGGRPAVERGMAVGKELSSGPEMDADAKKILFGHEKKE